MLLGFGLVLVGSAFLYWAVTGQDLRELVKQLGVKVK